MSNKTIRYEFKHFIIDTLNELIRTEFKIKQFTIDSADVKLYTDSQLNVSRRMKINIKNSFDILFTIQVLMSGEFNDDAFYDRLNSNQLITYMMLFVSVAVDNIAIPLDGSISYNKQIEIYQHGKEFTYKM